MDRMEPPVGHIRFPKARENVVSALRSLADRTYQEQEWGVYRKERSRYDDLSLTVNLLYDHQVLPNPADCIGDVLFPSEVEPLLCLSKVLEPLIEELGDRPDLDYMKDPRWTLVVEAAAVALTVFDQNDTSV